MPLSTSNSRRATGRDVAVLLVMCVLVCCCLELTTIDLFNRVSKVEHRRQSELIGALSLHSLRDQQRMSVLVCGNSLLLEGVDFPQLQRSIGPDFQLRRTAFENTYYLDWYYGLRHIFKTGSRPDVVVLMMNPIQLTSSAVIGDYSVHFLVDRDDLVSYSKDVKAGRNEMSSLVLDKWSAFYGTRAQIRTYIVDRILPGFPGLLRRDAVASVIRESSGDLAGQRLIQLTQLCAKNGADLVFVLPPATQGLGTQEVLSAARANDINMLIPIMPGVLPASDFSDNFHLNGRGSAQFTPLLASSLREVLRRPTDERGVAVSALLATDHQTPDEGVRKSANSSDISHLAK